ncbi:MAG: radical SAM protein [Firmicutes bacterium]|nr:radical SAM protein [Bacillota bacterium]
MIIVENNKNYLDEIKNIAVINNRLFQVEIDVTYKCNAKCFFCYQGENHVANDEISTSRLKELLHELKKLGTYYIGFSGGEPFARSDFLDILRYAKQLGFRVSVISNGHLLNRNVILNLASIGIERLTYSFHSTDKMNYDFHFGLNNDTLFYNRAIDNIKFSIESGISVGIATTVTKYNIDDIPTLLEYFIDLGLSKKDINLNLLLEGNQSIDDYRPSQEQLERNSQYFLEKELRTEFFCSAGRITCSIDSKGNVYPCTFFNTPAGNINQTKIKDIWENSHYLKIIRSLNINNFVKCVNCEVRNTCNPCLVSNLNETGSIFKPSESFCLAQKHKIGGL